MTRVDLTSGEIDQARTDLEIRAGGRDGCPLLSVWISQHPSVRIEIAIFTPSFTKIEWVFSPWHLFRFARQAGLDPRSMQFRVCDIHTSRLRALAELGQDRRPAKLAKLWEECWKCNGDISVAGWARRRQIRE